MDYLKNLYIFDERRDKLLHCYVKVEEDHCYYINNNCKDLLTGNLEFLDMIIIDKYLINNRGVYGGVKIIRYVASSEQQLYKMVKEYIHQKIENLNEIIDFLRVQKSERYRRDEGLTKIDKERYGSGEFGRYCMFNERED